MSPLVVYYHRDTESTEDLLGALRVSVANTYFIAEKLVGHRIVLVIEATI